MIVVLPPWLAILVVDVHSRLDFWPIPFAPWPIVVFLVAIDLAV